MEISPSSWFILSSVLFLLPPAFGEKTPEVLFAPGTWDQFIICIGPVLVQLDFYTNPNLSFTLFTLYVHVWLFSLTCGVPQGSILVPFYFPFQHFLHDTLSISLSLIITSALCIINTRWDQYLDVFSGVFVSPAATTGQYGENQISCHFLPNT